MEGAPLLLFKNWPELCRRYVEATDDATKYLLAGFMFSNEPNNLSVLELLFEGCMSTIEIPIRVPWSLLRNTYVQRVVAQDNPTDSPIYPEPVYFAQLDMIEHGFDFTASCQALGVPLAHDWEDWKDVPRGFQWTSGFDMQPPVVYEENYEVADEDFVMGPQFVLVRIVKGLALVEDKYIDVDR